MSSQAPHAWIQSGIILLAAVFLFDLSGCAGKPYEARFTIVREGQTKREITEALGPPDFRVKGMVSGERWLYDSLGGDDYRFSGEEGTGTRVFMVDLSDPRYDKQPLLRSGRGRYRITLRMDFGEDDRMKTLNVVVSQPRFFL